MENTQKLEKRLSEIDRELLLPAELGGRIPFDSVLKDEKKYVLTRKMVNEIWVIEVFPAEGIWEKVFNLLEHRKQILQELEKIAQKEVGYFSLVQKEEAEIEEAVTGTEPETKSEKMEEYII